MKTFGELVKTLRKDAKLTTTALGTRIGVSSEFITQVEKGRKYPSISTLEKISHILGNELKIIYFREHRSDILEFISKNKNIIIGKK